MDKPLLSTEGKASYRSQWSRVWQHWHTIHGLLREWWTTAFSSEYLLSSFAGRAHWHLLLPGWWLTNLLVDCGNHAEPVLICVDVACVLLVVFATSCLQRGTLWPDILITAMIGLFMLINVYLTAAGYQSIAGVPNKSALISYALVCNMLHFAMASFLGVHPCAIACGLIFTIAVSAWAGMGLYGLTGGLIGIVVVTLPSVRAMRTFALQKALQTLLDEAADGFFSVELQTSTIHFASSKLEALFGRRLPGIQFTSFLSLADARHFKEAVNQEIEHTREILVSCEFVSNDLSKSFEARLIPYSKSSWDVKLYLQLAGEVRTQSLDSAAHTDIETPHIHDASAIYLDSVGMLQGEKEAELHSTVSTTPKILLSGVQEILAAPEAEPSSVKSGTISQTLWSYSIGTISEERGIDDHVMSEINASDSVSQAGRGLRRGNIAPSLSNPSAPSASDVSIKRNLRQDRMFSELRRKDKLTYYDSTWKATNDDSYLDEAYRSILQDLAASCNFEHASCCNWHDALDRLVWHLAHMSCWKSCSDTWPQEAPKWQCGACGSLQFSHDEGCWVCYTERPDHASQRAAI